MNYIDVEINIDNGDKLSATGDTVVVPGSTPGKETVTVHTKHEMNDAQRELAELLALLGNLNGVTASMLTTLGSVESVSVDVGGKRTTFTGYEQEIVDDIKETLADCLGNSYNRDEYMSSYSELVHNNSLLPVESPSVTLITSGTAAVSVNGIPTTPLVALGVTEKYLSNK